MTNEWMTVRKVDMRDALRRARREGFNNIQSERDIVDHEIAWLAERSLPEDHVAPPSPDSMLYRLQQMGYALDGGNIAQEDVPVTTIRQWLLYVINGGYKPDMRYDTEVVDGDWPDEDLHFLPEDDPDTLTAERTHLLRALLYMWRRGRDASASLSTSSGGCSSATEEIAEAHRCAEFAMEMLALGDVPVQEFVAALGEEKNTTGTVTIERATLIAALNNAAYAARHEMPCASTLTVATEQYNALMRQVKKRVS